MSGRRRGEVAMTRGVSRRTCLLSLPAAWGLLSVATPASAGGQLEEPLADSVRVALRAAVANSGPPEPVFRDTDSFLHYVRWKVEMSTRLERRKTDFKATRERDDFLQAVWYHAKRAGLEPALVLGLIEVESAFRRYAVSSVGARGYMQVMPFWTRLIGDGDPGTLFDRQINVNYGSVILRHYLNRELGDVFMALGRYNGSRGQSKYPKAVMAARRNWEFAG